MTGVQTCALPISLHLAAADPCTLSRWHCEFAVNPSSLAALPAMTHMLAVAGIPGGLGFQKVGSVWMMVGEPLAPSWAWSHLVYTLLSLTRATGAVPCFAPVSAEFAALLSTLGFLNVRLGSAPYIHLQNWPQSGNPGSGVRNARNRAVRDGIEFSHLWPGQNNRNSPEEQQNWQREVTALSAEWLTGHRFSRPFRWIFDLRPLAFQEVKHYFEARCEGRLIGLIAASPLPGRASWYLEDVLRARGASAATGTALVAYALDAFKTNGLHLVTLGGVPLSRARGWAATVVTPLERAAYCLRPLLSRLYSFDGLEMFKRRFGPAHWEDEYLALPGGLWPRFKVAAAIARLILFGR